MRFPIGSWERLTVERIREARGLVFRLQFHLGRLEMQLAALKKKVGATPAKRWPHMLRAPRRQNRGVSSWSYISRASSSA